MHGISETYKSVHDTCDLTGEKINTVLYYMYAANELRRTLQSLSRMPRRLVLGVLPDVPNQKRPSE